MPTSTFFQNKAINATQELKIKFWPGQLKKSPEFLAESKCFNKNKTKILPQGSFFSELYCEVQQHCAVPALPMLC
jgi:hypothetical protein